MYDMKHLDKLKTITENAPASMKAFWTFNTAAMADGVIPVRTKRLIAMAVALTTQCPYCIELHTNDARKDGVSDEEIAEVVVIAMALRAGAALTHGTHCYPTRS